MNTLTDILTTVVVGPNDQLVIVLPDDTTLVRLAQMREQLREFNPELSSRVLFVAGVQELAVLKGGAPTTTVAFTRGELQAQLGAEIAERARRGWMT